MFRTSLGQDTPTDVDEEGSQYTFEKGVTKNSGSNGFADVWKREYFAWEYKAKHKDLNAAYQQLLKYREALESPPLLVVCDLDRFEIHTNWTNTSPEIYAFCLQDLISNQPTENCKLPPLDVLSASFTDPSKLKPGQTTAEVTTEAASEFGQLAQSLRRRRVSAENAAHYVMRLLFCLFAEGVGLLPEKLFSRLIENNRFKPEQFVKKLRSLFAAMSKGGSFGADDIPYFDGGLFMNDEAYELTREDLGILARAARLSWGSIEPAIFGTLFERILDPNKRAQIGAHYTSKEDILLIVEPVLMEPLRRRWRDVQQQAIELSGRVKGRIRGSKVQRQISELLDGFAAELAAIRVLDPACGSGNFLYVALKRLLDLEKEISVFANNFGLSPSFIRCRPSQLYGVESNIYAHEVASVAVWIGFLQWQRNNFGVIITSDPVMYPLENIRCMDALLDHDKSGKPIEPHWPDCDVIIGNPPFLGGKRQRTELGDKYVDELFTLYKGRVPHEADFVCYWFEKARQQLQEKRAKRVGLLATQGIRSGASSKVLERIKQSGDIFMGWSDRPWILEGAAVRVSMIGFDAGAEKQRTLDGAAVATINANLSSTIDLTTAHHLRENVGIAFQGPVKVGSFELKDNDARGMLKAANPNGRSNAEVIKPWMNASDVTRRPRNMWIIDFGDRCQKEAALFERPFEYVKKHIKASREAKRDRQRRMFWWRLGRSGGDFKKAKQVKSRVIVTPRVAKHRLFVWATVELVPDSRLIGFARDDDYFFGVLHSRVHEVWTLHTCSWHGKGNDPTYNTGACFETFPFPFAPGREPKNDLRLQKIGTAARELIKKRDTWLNPPAASEEQLKKLTLTNLYNENPTWLKDAHAELDEVVFTAYDWPMNISDGEILARLLALNAERFGTPKAEGELQFEPLQAKQPKKPAGVVRLKKAPRSAASTGA